MLVEWREGARDQRRRPVRGRERERAHRGVVPGLGYSAELVRPHIHIPTYLHLHRL